MRTFFNRDLLIGIGNISDAYQAANKTIKDIRAYFNPSYINMPNFGRLLKNEIALSLAKKENLVEFLFESKILQRMAFYDHDLTYDENDIPLIKFKDGWKSLEEIARTFTIINDENTVKNPIIVRKSDAQRFYYLESGLTEHDFESQMRSYKTKEATGQCWVESVCTDHGNTTTPGGISRLIGAHAWIRLENKSGTVYSVGRIASQIVCPDPFEYSKRHQLVARTPLDSFSFNQIYHKIKVDVETDQKQFNLLEDNCSVYTNSIAQMIFPNLEKTPFEPWGSFDNIELDIKVFSVAFDITKLIESNRSKFLEFSQELENQNGDTQKAMDNFIDSQLEGPSRTKTSLKSLLYILSETKALKTAEAYGAREYIEEASIKLRSFGDKNSTLSKTYNLLKDVQESLNEFSIAHPYTLHLNLKEQPGVKELKIKPKVR